MRACQNLALNKRPIFYGWIVVACVFVILFVAFGSVYSFSTFFESLQLEFQTSRGSVSFVFAIAGFLYFSLGALSGQIADRFGSRWIITFGVIVIGISLLIASRAATIWQIYIVYGLGIGIGVGLSYVPAVSVVQRWFVKQRGIASGIAVTGIGLGTLGMPFFSGFLIQYSNWRTAYLVMSLFVFAFGITAALLIVDKPERLNLVADGNKLKTGSGKNFKEIIEQKQDISVKNIRLRDAVIAKPFLLLYAGSLIASLGLFIPFVHLLPFSKDLGLSTSTGVVLFSLIGVGSTLGRFLIGWIADKFGRRLSLAIIYTCISASFAWWLVAKNAFELGLFAILFGIFYGGYVALLPTVTADYFDGPDLSGIIGALYTNVAVGNLIGPPLAGFIFDLRNSYTIPIFICFISALFSAVCTFILQEPIKWRESFLSSTMEK